MQRNKGQGLDQLDDREAHIMPCRMHIERAPATPAQRHAWTCLWRMLLEEGHSPKNVDASGEAIPEASQNDGTDFADRAAGTAFISSRRGNLP
jgi:hypothetical protein